MDRDTIEITFRVKTQNTILIPATEEFDLPIRRWQVELLLLDKSGNELTANILSSCTMLLHPSFEDSSRIIKQPPFIVQETGWGEFDITMMCTLKYHGGSFKIVHDLLFEEDAYICDYTVHIPNESPNLRNELLPYYDIPEIKDSYPDYTKIPNNWRDIRRLDEEEISEFVQIMLDDKAVQGEINKYDRREPFYMYLGQLPMELQENLSTFLKESMNKRSRKKQKNQKN